MRCWRGLDPIGIRLLHSFVAAETAFNRLRRRCLCGVMPSEQDQRIYSCDARKVASGGAGRCESRLCAAWEGAFGGARWAQDPVRHGSQAVVRRHRRIVL